METLPKKISLSRSHKRWISTSTSILMHSTLFLQKKIALEIHTFFSAWMKEARRKMLVAWWEQFWPTFDHLSGNSILTGIKYSLRIFSVRKKMLVKTFENHLKWKGIKNKILCLSNTQKRTLGVFPMKIFSLKMRHCNYSISQFDIWQLDFNDLQNRAQNERKCKFLRVLF